MLFSRAAERRFGSVGLAAISGQRRCGWVCGLRSTLGIQQGHRSALSGQRSAALGSAGRWSASTAAESAAQRQVAPMTRRSGARRPWLLRRRRRHVGRPGGAPCAAIASRRRARRRRRSRSAVHAAQHAQHGRERTSTAEHAARRSVAARLLAPLSGLCQHGWWRPCPACVSSAGGAPVRPVSARRVAPLSGLCQLGWWRPCPAAGRVSRAASSRPLGLGSQHRLKHRLYGSVGWTRIHALNILP